MNRDSDRLESMLDRLGDAAQNPGSFHMTEPVDAPHAFLTRVRRARSLRRAAQAGVAVLTLACVLTIVLFVNGSGPEREINDTQGSGGPLMPDQGLVNLPGEHSPGDENQPVPESARLAVEWPALPNVGTGGPAIPLRAGMRPTSTMARSILR